MRKKLLSLLCVGAMTAGACLGFVGCGDDETDNREKLIIWVSETSGVATKTTAQVKEFFDANEVSEYNNYNVIVRGITESEAATTMVSDIRSGADVYCFAQDQMGRLLEANALAALSTNQAAWVASNNDASSVTASIASGNTYCYPLTSDNTYFMYYDTRVINAEHIGDLASIVADCKAAGKNFSFELGGSAWYTASFFFGAGCTSSWTLNTETKKWTAADNFNSANGLIALEGMQILTTSGVWADSSKASDFTAATPSAVVISGTWDSKTAKLALSEGKLDPDDPDLDSNPNYGKYLGVAKLPSYTVGEGTYQLKGFTGYKLMGVKPQSDPIKASLCHELAKYLSGEKCQLDRFKDFGWGPSNKAAQANEAVQADPILKAVGEASAVGVPQGQIHGGWWDFAKLLGQRSKEWAGHDVKTEKGRQEILDEYTKDLNKYENMTDEDMEAFGVIGSIASLVNTDLPLAAGQTSWSNWGADLAMTKSADGLTWTSPAIVLAAGDEFKVRQGQSWSVQFSTESGDNYKITADNAGTYQIQLVLTKKANGDIETGVVSLIPAQA